MGHFTEKQNLSGGEDAPSTVGPAELCSLKKILSITLRKTNTLYHSCFTLPSVCPQVLIGESGVPSL